MILEWQAALAEAAQMSRRWGGEGGPQKVRHLYLDPGLFLPSAKLTRGAADPRLPGCRVRKHPCSKPVTARNRQEKSGRGDLLGATDPFQM